MQFFVLHALIVAIMCAKVVMPLGVSTIFKCAKVEKPSDAVPCHGRCDGGVVKGGCTILVSINGGPKQQLGTLKVNLNFFEAKARLSRCFKIRIWLPSGVKSIQLTVAPVVVGEEPDGTRSMSSNVEAFSVFRALGPKIILWLGLLVLLATMSMPKLAEMSYSPVLPTRNAELDDYMTEETLISVAGFAAMDRMIQTAMMLPPLWGTSNLKARSGRKSSRALPHTVSSMCLPSRHLYKRAMDFTTTAPSRNCIPCRQ